MIYAILVACAFGWTHVSTAFGFPSVWFIDLRQEHLVYDCAPRLSPLPASTYMDEDMVGKVKRFALRSHPTNLGYQVLQRYSAYVCVRWLRQLTEWCSTPLEISSGMLECFSLKPPSYHLIVSTWNPVSWRALACFLWCWCSSRIKVGSDTVEVERFGYDDINLKKSYRIDLMYCWPAQRVLYRRSFFRGV